MGRGASPPPPGGLKSLLEGPGPHLPPLTCQTSPAPALPLSLPQWRAFLELGDSIPDDVLNQVIDSQKPNQCCALIYRLVATGPPKAIMLSHDNVSGPPREAGRALGRCSGCHLDHGELLGAENQTARLSDYLDHVGHSPEPALQAPPRGAGGPGELPASQLHGGPDLRHVGHHLGGRSTVLCPARRSESEWGPSAAWVGCGSLEGS